MKVKNIQSKANNAIANQYIITVDNFIYFQSYDKIIVKINTTTGKTVLDVNYWDYSKTTGKYRNIFLNETKQETEKKLKSGAYTLEDLNT